MSYAVEALQPFKRDLKRLLKKYPSLLDDVETLGRQLAVDPHKGTPLGINCYKIRLAISSKGRGKSGGARVITHVMVTRSTVYLLDIYDKSDTASLSKEELMWLVKLVPR